MTKKLAKSPEDDAPIDEPEDEAVPEPPPPAEPAESAPKAEATGAWGRDAKE